MAILIILFAESDKHDKDKKSKIKTKILKRIFRQDEVRDSTPEGPPVDHSNAYDYGLLHSIQCEDVKIPCPDEQSFIKGWFMKPEDSMVSNTVVLYSHGVSNTRGASYRVALYNILVMQGVTVMAYDYRGFGDSSTAVPAEDSVVQDCRTVLQWLRTRLAGDCRIVVWGHSLGAAITSHAVALEFREKQDETGVAGVVLEAPFNNMADELKVAINDVNNVFMKNVVKVFFKLGGLSKMTKDYNIEFQSDRWLCQIPCPVLVLAAEDDQRIPVSLTNKLVQKTRKEGKENITFHTFPSSGNFGHKYMYRAENMPSLFSDFCKTLSK